MAEKQKIFITGGTGFIGSNLISSMYSHYDITVLVRSFSSFASLSRFKNINVVHGDLTNHELINDTVSGVDCVVHLAYDPSSQKSNIAGINSLVDACIKHSKKLVHMSTISVYEPLMGDTITEATNYDGSTYSYAKDKKAVERVVSDAIKQRNLQSIILQPTIIYGPYSGPWTDRIVGQLRTGDVVIPDNDSSICNTVYVDDVTDSILLSINTNSCNGETFLITGPDYVSWETFFESYAAMVGDGRVMKYSMKLIKKYQRNPLRLARIILGDPKKAVDWEPMKSILKSLQYKLSPKVKTTIKSLYMSYKKISPRALFVPNKPLLDLFNSGSMVEIGKAKKLLNYNPKYAFNQGIKKTEAYVKWAYPNPLEKGI